MTKSNLILIYGVDGEKMRQSAADRRAKDASVEIKLCDAAKFTPDAVRTCREVIVIGSFPEIADSYAGKAEVSVYDNDVFYKKETEFGEMPSIKPGKRNKKSAE